MLLDDLKIGIQPLYHQPAHSASPCVFKLIIFLCFFYPSVSRAEVPIKDQAAQLFEQGQYAQSLRLYYSLIKTNDTTLYYNIAVCYFKLKQWPQAKIYFLKVLASNMFNDDALYSLGVVYKKLEHYAKAQEIFYELSIEALDDQISEAAYQQYLILKDQRSKAGLDKKRGRLTGLISSSFGRDTNVLVQGEETASQRSDNFIESIFSLSWLQNSSQKNFWGANLLIYDANYESQDDYDVRAYSASIDYNWRLRSSNIQIASSLTDSEVGSRDYMQDITLDLSWEKNIDATSQYQIETGYKISDEKNNEFEPFAGSETFLKASYLKNFSMHYFIIDASTHQLDKNNFSDRQNFRSYSGNRQRLKVSYRYKFRPWLLNFTGVYRIVDYDGSYVLARQTLGPRKDRFSKLKLKLDYQFSSHFSGFIELSNANNHSNLSIYSYDQNVYLSGIIWLF